MAIAAAAAPGAASGQNIIGALLPFVVLMGVLYFMVLRPQKTQQKKREEMMAGLRKGNRVVTIGGIYGEILEVKDGALFVNVADQGERIVIRVAKWAVQDVIGKDNQPKEKDEAAG
ncbi:MAG TPA: preprotein translocase subunit YajC [Firmicutes bacterium]|jgi:preprotein translocase subunit YajC|nr:preprotein translocase subunit YajC [Bacillota bacterium]HBK61070.1 preprotein translocase subunit YajC [Bacillota bacterium]